MSVAVAESEPSLAVDSNVDRGVTMLYGPQPVRWLLAAVWDWGVIVATISLASWLNHWAGYFLAVVVVGNRQHALGILGHDGAHRLITKKRWLNDFLASVVCFWPLMSGLHAYRRFHFDHHRHLGTTRDPELYQKGMNRPIYDLPAKRRGIALQFFRDLFGAGAMEVAKLFLTDLRPRTWSDRVGPLLWWSVVGTLVVLSGCWWAAAIWFAAMWTSMWAFFRIRIWSEHQGTAETHRLSVAWWERIFLPHNTWCHHEHHRWPAISFGRLPDSRAYDTSTRTETLRRLFAQMETSSACESGAPLAELASTMPAGDKKTPQSDDAAW